MTLPQRLNHIRQQLDLTLQEVSERTGIAVSSLSEFENGKREPSLSQLQKLASVYEKPLPFFFEETPVREAVLLWRAKPAEPTSNRIQAKFEKLCKQYHNLETWTKEPLRDSFKRLFTDAFPTNYQEVERLAHKIGNEMGLGERPGESLLRVLEEVYGVKVFHLDLGNSASSACTCDEVYGPAILLNRSNKPWRRSFDLAHELFHLVTWKARVAMEGCDIADEQEESYANTFASRLLLPDEPFRDVIEANLSPDGKITYESLDTIARQFGVSLDALFWRMSSLYRIPAEDVRRMIEEAKSISELPPRQEDAPAELPHRYLALAVKALRHGQVSSAQFAHYLNIGVSEVDEYTRAHVPEPLQITTGHP